MTWLGSVPKLMSHLVGQLQQQPEVQLREGCNWDAGYAAVIQLQSDEPT